MTTTPTQTQNQLKQESTPSQTQNKPLTFTEEFLRMKEQLQSITNFIYEIESLLSIIGRTHQSVLLLEEQLQALYDLSESKKPITRASIIEQANRRRVVQLETAIQEDVKAGLLTPKDVIESESDMVLYKSDQVLLAFSEVSKLKNPADLIGKKAGDKVAEIEVVQIFSSSHSQT